METAETTTIVIAIVAVASNVFTMYHARQQSRRQGREDWRLTTGKAYVDGRRALRRFVGDISDSALAHAPNRPADFPHYVGVAEADARFSASSASLLDAYEEIEQYGTSEVRDLFSETMARAQVLPRLRGQGGYPGEPDHAGSTGWSAAHDEYRSAFERLARRMALEREKSERASR
ncbi:hypothetical protein ACFFGH_29360 [Lysobacter korlensis]|uniref:DUF4760 domain-containing protein n=1 Tax=Lysobacter korlensis TaxID=553636 RepID=A0ABV6RYU0_9GAMM